MAPSRPPRLHDETCRCPTCEAANLGSGDGTARVMARLTRAILVEFQLAAERDIPATLLSMVAYWLGSRAAMGQAPLGEVIDGVQAGFRQVDPAAADLLGIGERTKRLVCPKCGYDEVCLVVGALMVPVRPVDRGDGVEPVASVGPSGRVQYVIEPRVTPRAYWCNECHAQFDEPVEEKPVD